MILRCIKILLCLFLLSCEGENNNPFSQSVEQKYVSIAYLRSLYSSSVRLIDEDVFFEGYVVSSDASNNFYHTLVVEDDTGGIEILIDMDDYYLNYSLFSYLKVSAKGLYISSISDNIRLGASSLYYYVEDIPQEYLSSFITLSSDFESYTYTFLSLSQLTDRYLSCLVTIDNLFLDEDGYLYDSENNRIKLYVSDYANFSFADSTGECVVMGVISKSEGEYCIQPSRKSHVLFY
ncbi:MAG: DUF5689 domain-containing protein [Rikenellaceae bacterium]